MQRCMPSICPRIDGSSGMTAAVPSRFHSHFGMWRDTHCHTPNMGNSYHSARISCTLIVSGLWLRSAGVTDVFELPLSSPTLYVESAIIVM